MAGREMRRGAGTAACPVRADRNPVRQAELNGDHGTEI